MSMSTEGLVEFTARQQNLTDEELVVKIKISTELHEGAVLYPTMQEYAADLRQTLAVLDSILTERGLPWPEGVRR